MLLSHFTLLKKTARSSQFSTKSVKLQLGSINWFSGLCSWLHTNIALKCNWLCVTPMIKGPLNFWSELLVNCILLKSNSIFWHYCLLLSYFYMLLLVLSSVTKQVINLWDKWSTSKPSLTSLSYLKLWPSDRNRFAHIKNWNLCILWSASAFQSVWARFLWKETVVLRPH